MPKRDPRHHAWCFTINNYTPTQADAIKNLATCSGLEYLICGKETAPTTHTSHLQGYFRFKNARSASTIQDLLSPGEGHIHAHLTAAKGTDHQNREYCSKTNIWVEAGQLSSRGKPKATDANPSGLNEMLLQYQRDVNLGLTEDKLWETHPLVRFRYTSGANQCIERYQNTLTKPDPIIFVCYGPTGCGKSHWIRKSFGDAAYWVTLSSNRTWYGGYDPKKHYVIVFDDFESRNLDRQNFKLMTDKYSCLVEPKGKQIPMVSKYIVFSSNDDPKTWYRNPEIMDQRDDVHYQACQRRIGSRVLHFTHRYNHKPNYDCGHLLYRPVYTPCASSPVVDVNANDEPYRIQRRVLMNTAADRMRRVNANANVNDNDRVVTPPTSVSATLHDSDLEDDSDDVFDPRSSDEDFIDDEDDDDFDGQNGNPDPDGECEDDDF